MSAFLVAAMIAFPQPPKTVRQLYVHAIQADGRDAAWGLLCRTDCQRVSRNELDQAVTDALTELGGNIEEAHPTRAAYEWEGVNGKRVFRNPETSGGARPCTRLGANPLGAGLQGAARVEARFAEASGRITALDARASRPAPGRYVPIVRGRS